jgi:hypothetical protein
MTRDEAEQWIKQHCGPTNYGEQDENGVDLSLIRANLALSPVQRLREGDRRRRSSLSMQEYHRRVRKKIRSAAPHLLRVYDKLGLHATFH